MGVPNDYWAIGADTENRMRAKSSKRHEFGSRIFSLHNLIASTGIGPQPGEGKGKGKAPTTVELLRCVAEINCCYCCQDSTMYDSYDVHAVAVCKWNWNWNAYALVCNFLLFLQYSSIRTRTHTHTHNYIHICDFFRPLDYAHISFLSYKSIILQRWLLLLLCTISHPSIR